MFTVIADQALDHEILQIEFNFPNSGEVMISGHPLSRGIHLHFKELIWYLGLIFDGTQTAIIN